MDGVDAEVVEDGELVGGGLGVGERGQRCRAASGVAAVGGDDAVRVEGADGAEQSGLPGGAVGAGGAQQQHGEAGAVGRVVDQCAVGAFGGGHFGSSVWVGWLGAVPQAPGGVIRARARVISAARAAGLSSGAEWVPSMTRIANSPVVSGDHTSIEPGDRTGSALPSTGRTGTARAGRVYPSSTRRWFSASSTSDRSRTR